MTCEQCYVCEQTVLQCSRTMLLAMTYDLCHGGHMVAEYPLLHTPDPPPLPLLEPPLPRGPPANSWLGWVVGVQHRGAPLLL